MKKELIRGKIQGYLDRIHQRKFYNIKAIPPLTGTIYPDNRPEDGRPLTLKEGVLWGGKEHGYKVSTSIVFEKTDDTPLYLCLDLGNSTALEALAFLYGPEGLVAMDGEVVYGVDPYHKISAVPERFIDGGAHEVTIDGWTGIKEEVYKVEGLMTCHRHEALERFALHGEVILDLMDSDRGDTLLFTRIREQYMAVLKDIVFEEESRLLASVKEALSTYEAQLASYPKGAVLDVYACGHGHLDIAWLWDIDQSKKKGAQTFSNVLAILERDPSLKFSQTQMQLYAFIEDNYPGVFKGVVEAIEQGHWEVLGKSWVEFDSNITGAESLVRQFVLGQAYIDEKLGGHCSPVAWLPDTFGFCGQLPQILKGVGIDYFATAKLTWNSYNKFPYEHFRWEGLDGSSVLAHVVSTSKPGWWGATYSADMTAKELLQTEANIQQKEQVDAMLVAYGRGDGGGGPTADMSARVDLMNRYPVLPEIKKTDFHDFFTHLATHEEDLSSWVGELYFELHRGTYTSQAKTKKGNRRSEQMLHDAEFLMTWADSLNLLTYPADKFQELWQKVCLSQFHDILPGSSVARVYERVEAEYEAIGEQLQAIIDEGIKALSTTAPKSADYMVVNTSPVKQAMVLALPPLAAGMELCDLYGNPLTTCHEEDHTLVHVEAVPGYATVYLKAVETHFTKAPKNIAREAAEGVILENDLLKVSLNHQGEITAMWDKEVGRAVTLPGESANVWQLFEDMPADWEAWDIEAYYKDKVTATFKAHAMAITQNNGLRGTVTVEGIIGTSPLKQWITLEKDSRILIFETWVDWRERKKLLRVTFPVQIHNDRAAFDSQWGHVYRPTTENTTWEQAQFEAWGHQWADISEGDYGVALLSDCKYGYSVKGNTLGLTALKSATFPDPEADLGHQTFKYGLHAHEGGNLASTVAAGYGFNSPLSIHAVDGQSPSLATGKTFVQASDRLLIETVKKAEDGDGIILRGYEWQNSRGAVTIETDMAITEAVKCDLLENDLEKLKEGAGKIELSCRPYEIVTVKCR